MDDNTVQPNRDDLLDSVSTQLQERIQNLETLLQISETVNSTLDLTEILNQIAKQSVKALHATRAVLFLQESPRDDFVTLVSEYDERNLQESKKTGRYELSEHSLNQKVMETQETIQFHVDDHSEFLNDSVRESFHELDIESVLMVPLVRNQQPIGLFAVDQAYEKRVFTDEEIRLARIFANQAAIALKNAELFNSVQDEKRQIESIIQSSWDGIVVTDEEGIIKLCNPSFVAAFKITERSIVGRKLDHVLADLNYVMTPEKMPTVAGKEEKIQKYKISAASGKRYFQAVSSPFIYNSEQDGGQILVLRDVTHEEHLRKLREDLTQMVVHDLKNPLSAVMAYIEATTSGVLGDLNERQQDFLQRAYNNASLLLNMISDILDIHKAEEKDINLKMARGSLHDPIKNALDQLESEQSAKKIEVRADLQDVPETLFDFDVITRVCVNLLHNAFKFSPSGSSVHVRLYADDTWIYMQVQDYGPGISEEYRERIFEKFVQVEDSEIKHRMSSGLGLTFCKLMITAHGGDIRVDSVLNEGSTFTFKLPLQ